MMANNLPAGKMYKKPIKKNVGLRAFFPEMPISMSNLEKAKIWVKRHNNNYFMGWTQEQLQSLDPIVRPLTIITPELYKRHMNRSEYCRIVKLKYCLESDADWAKEFRRRLGTDSSKGGFRSLGEAKLYATQLWRQYSELYDVHRARIGNSNSRASLEKHHSLDGSSRDTKAIHISSGSAISSSAASLLPLSGSPDSLIPPFRREDDKLLSLHLASMDESNNHHLNEFPSSSSLNISPLIKVEREEKFESSSTTISNETNWSVDNNKVSSSHNTPVFPSVDQMELSILERVDVLLRRRRKDFFLGYTEDQLRNLSPFERPLTTVTEKEYQEYLFSDEGQLTSALATVFDLTEPWAFRFKKMLHLSPEEGGFATWPDVKQELYVLLQNHLSGNSNSQESVVPSMLDGSHGTMPSLSLDSDLPSTSGLVERASENIDFTNTSSSMLLGKDSLKESTISLFSSGILNGRLTSQKKSPDSSDRTVVSQASPSAPETTEDAITIDDDTNSEDNFAAGNQSQMKSPPVSSNGPSIDNIWSTNNSSSNDHRRAANHLQQQFLSDSSVSITSSIERSGHSVTAVSSSLSAMATPNRFGSPLGKVSNRISLDLASFGRNQGNSEQLECSPMEPRNSRVVPRFSSQSAMAMDTGSVEVPTVKTSNRSNPSRLVVAGSNSLYSNNNSSSKSLVSKLWSLRDKLAERCRDDPAVSWHDKLRPHLKLIRSQLGETYTLPSSVHESIADLFLVTLQLELLDKQTSGFSDMS
ncbi:Hypothetical predicted protein [Octopus vulgaris]|uniref:Uncharacterized protein n=2 Tax=Octopus vulgaris TaxID=6645 RepID=A0AA36EYB7_OCTVU|nr:Hypothetical predicted protein [Octopus vulgaris]